MPIFFGEKLKEWVFVFDGWIRINEISEVCAVGASDVMPYGIVMLLALLAVK